METEQPTQECGPETQAGQERMPGDDGNDDEEDYRDGETIPGASSGDDGDDDGDDDGGGEGDGGKRDAAGISCHSAAAAAEANSG